ncbi:MAG: hypothetical protein KC656_01425 [Myxococcales bacterium]|nr:hypothetical protein [Myxococcales bacterium]MCB9669735.1 hypothetical protein [Alphaproteobacteria bacterium]
MLVLASALAGTPIPAAFPPPPGAERVDPDAFGTWLRTLEVLEVDRPVRTYKGGEVGHRARVIDLPLVPGDLQQCADSAIRLRAQWLHDRGEPVMFHATSGDPMPWSRWEGGERPYVVGNHLAWKPGTKGGWEAYLAAVFMWAGTLSLSAHDTVAVDRAPVPGDLLVKPGSPGHAVVLLDVATAGDRTWVLVGEGYMPAQDFHVELGPDAGWWPWDGGVTLSHWDLHGEAVHRAFR